MSRNDEHALNLARLEALKELAAERERLRLATEAIENAPHVYCDIQNEPHCSHCGKPESRHGYTTGDADWQKQFASRCKDDRGRPELTSWSPLPPKPCNCWKSSYLAQLAQPAPVQPAQERGRRKDTPVYRVSYDVAGQLDRHHAMCGPDKPAAIREYNSAVSRGRPRVKLERSYKYETPWEVIDVTAEAPKEKS